MGTITVMFKDPEQQYIIVQGVSKYITISNLRTVFKQNGGNESEGQWRINGKILEDSKKLSDYIPKSYSRPLITISTVSSVRGG